MDSSAAGDGQYNFSVPADTLACPICLVAPVLEPVVSNKCGHSLCASCQEDGKVKECPICRQTGCTYHANFFLRAVLEQLPSYQERLRQNSVDFLKEQLATKYSAVKEYCCNLPPREERKVLRLLLSTLVDTWDHARLKDSMVDPTDVCYFMYRVGPSEGKVLWSIFKPSHYCKICTATFTFFVGRDKLPIFK